MKASNSLILLFDGECNLCNRTVQFVIERDSKAQVKFASLQSEAGLFYKQKFSIPEAYIDSIILIEGDKIYYKSTAALRLSRVLNGLWSAVYVGIIVPNFLRNWVYDFIAKNRIRWFGKADTCWVMTPDLKDRFL